MTRVPYPGRAKVPTCFVFARGEGGGLRVTVIDMHITQDRFTDSGVGQTHSGEGGFGRREWSAVKVVGWKRGSSGQVWIWT